MVSEYITDNIGQVVSALHESDTISLDLETTGLVPLDSRILLCQVGTRERNFVIDTGKVDISPLLPLFTSHKWVKIIQNSKFERRFFRNKYNIPINNVYDTQLAERLLKPDNYRYGLDDLAEKYAGVKLDKKIRRSFFERKKFNATEEQIEYASKDIEVLWPIMEAQKKRLAEYGMEILAKLEFDLAQVVADMEEEGVPIDKAKWRLFLNEFEEEHEASRNRLLDLIYSTNLIDEQLGLFARGGINASSPDQIKKAFVKIGIDVETTNEREIALIDHPAARELLEYRGLDKIMKSYGQSSFLDKIHPFTNRIHADFQQIGTETGRFACKDPNLQQMPAKFRECVSLDDWQIVGADYSQIELRILAELSGDRVMLDAFNRGDDIHKATAATMFSIPATSVTKEQRFTAKTINFGIVYGMMAGKLKDILNAEARKNGGKPKTYNEAQEMLKRYHQTYPQVSRWLTDTANRAFISLESTTMYGRRRFYNAPDRVNLTSKDYDNQVGAIKRRGANTPIQGTNADITKLAMLDMYQNLEEGGYRGRIILQVHDEIVVLAHKREAEKVKEVVVDSMIRSAEKVLTKVPVVADAYISDIWKK